MRKFIIGVVVGFSLGLAAAYGGYRLWVDVWLRRTPTTTTASFVGLAPKSYAQTELPADVPLFSGATVTAKTFGGGQLTVTSATPEKADAVIAFYRQQLPAAGWEVEILQSRETLQERSETWRARKGKAMCDVDVRWVTDKTVIDLRYRSGL